MKIQLVADDLTPVGAYQALRARAKGAPSFLLESAPIGGERWGRYSIVGYRPRREIVVDLDGEQASLRVRDLHEGRELVRDTAPRSDVMRLLREHTFEFSGSPLGDDHVPRVVDGAVGYVAYDVVHALEPVEARHKASSPGPMRIVHLLEGATIVVFDALLQTVTLYGSSSHELQEVQAALSTRVPLPTLPMPDRAEQPAGVVVEVADADFESMVRRAQEYIGAGDIFQVVLARTFSVPRRGEDPFDVYRALRVLNPSPYLYYLELGRDSDMPPAQGSVGTVRAIAGASPETLVRLTDGQLCVRPLAGTRPRGKTDLEDEALEQELLADPKEIAEHVMLVDLGRNDVGRVSEIGSVRVPIQLTVERYSHVMHIMSEVWGRLGEGQDAWSALAATFPAGTLSGAPKVRAMQIIDELEPRQRGIYGGAVGYVSRHGTMDVAIAIRTIVATDERFEVGAGAGVVEASVPEREAQETRHKAGASLSAVACAQRAHAASRS